MTATVQSPTDVKRLVEHFRLLGHPVRLELLGILARGERRVGDLAVYTGQPSVLVSQQLALLRKAGLVLTRREAKQVFYRLDEMRLGGVMARLGQILGPIAPPQSMSTASKSQSRGISAAMFAQVEQRH